MKVTVKHRLPELSTSAPPCPFFLSHSPTQSPSLVQQEAGHDYHIPPTHPRTGWGQAEHRRTTAYLSLSKTDISLYLEYLVLYLLNLEKAW